MTDRDNAGSDELNSTANSEEVLRAEDVFLECDGVPLHQTAGAPTRPADIRPSGPGFWESVAWMIGLLVVQVVASSGQSL